MCMCFVFISFTRLVAAPVSLFFHIWFTLLFFAFTRLLILSLIQCLSLDVFQNCFAINGCRLHKRCTLVCSLSFFCSLSLCVYALQLSTRRELSKPNKNFNIFWWKDISSSLHLWTNCISFVCSPRGVESVCICVYEKEKQKSGDMTSSILSTHRNPSKWTLGFTVIFLEFFVCTHNIWITMHPSLVSSLTRTNTDTHSFSPATQFNLCSFLPLKFLSYWNSCWLQSRIEFVFLLIQCSRWLLQFECTPAKWDGMRTTRKIKYVQCGATATTISYTHLVVFIFDNSVQWWWWVFFCFLLLLFHSAKSMHELHLTTTHSI